MKKIILILLILLLLLIATVIIQSKESFQYATVSQPKTFSRREYNRMAKYDPGFGYHMWQFENAPKWNPNLENNLSKDPGAFGQLVSYLEQRSLAPSIKNLSV